MSPKPTPGPGQESLFDLTELEVAQQIPQISDTAEPTYAAVDVRQRAFELGKTLEALNDANEKAGIQMAAASLHRQALERRYGRNVDQVVEGARHAEMARLGDAKRHFAHAYGMYGMIGAGMDGKEAARRTAREFSAFTAKYGVGVTNAKVRNKKAKEIQKSADIIAKP